jgi:hypothetical protein
MAKALRSALDGDQGLALEPQDQMITRSSVCVQPAAQAIESTQYSHVPA